MWSSRRSYAQYLQSLLIVALLALAAGVVAPLVGATPAVVAAPQPSQADIVGQSGSVSFGTYVQVLPNGNIVVADPDYSPRFLQQIGAVHLYNGTTLAKISSLYGTTPGDQIGSGGVVVVGTNNIVVSSPLWANGANPFAGAATWINGATGLEGTIDASNSLVGANGFDNISNQPVIVLANGNYLVRSTIWNRPGIGNVGAITWGNGTTGITGAVSATNSLVGGTVGDGVGFSPSAKPAVVALTNGNYVVGSELWDNPNGTTPNAGAVTWGNGTTGTTGTVGATNSRIGQVANGLTGSGGIVPMVNGHYVVISPNTSFGGAVTWIDGTTTSTGSITATNTLTSSVPGFGLGGGGVTPLTNGNYVIRSTGAVEFRAAGAPNAVAGNNTLIGDTTGIVQVCAPVFDVGSAGVVPLTNGNYVVMTSTRCDQGAFLSDVWQVTWGNGVVGTSGAVGTSDTISMKRSCIFGDSVDGAPCLQRVVPLANGNYVIVSTESFSDTQSAFTTWGNGTAPMVGDLEWSNSLYAAGHDRSNFETLTPLANGDYLVRRFAADAGNSHVAGETWWYSTLYVAGDGPTVGPSFDAPELWAGSIEVGWGGPEAPGGADFALPNGNYVSTFPFWNETTGAVVLSSGSPIGWPGPSAANSLVGNAGDRVGEHAGGPSVVVFPNSTYAVISSYVDVPGPPPLPGDPDVTFVDAGAVTFVGLAGVHGGLDPSNSVFGGVNDGGASLTVAKDLLPNGSMVVGRPAEQIVTVFRTDFTPPTFPVVPPAVAVTAPGGSQGAVVTYPTPVAADGNVVSVVCVPPTGSVFAVGVTTVVCTATDGAGQTATTSFTVTVSPPPPTGGGGGEFVSLPPARVLDTRVGATTVDGLFAGGGALVAGGVLQLQIAGRGGVSLDASAVALNVTALGATAGGYVTVFPCGGDRPIASSVNFSAGSTTPNAVIAKVGAGGQVCLFVSEAAHLLADVNGYFPPTASFRSANPARLLDTRVGGSTVDGLQQGGGVVAAGSVTQVQVTGRASVPVGVVGVVVNVTVVQAGGAGYVTVFPCGGPPPNASNVNFGVGDTVANLVIAKVGVGGKVCVFAERAMDLLLDVTGYFPAGSTYGSLAPQRLADSRPASSTIDGQSQAIGRRSAGTVTAIQVTGRAGVPAGATTAVLNVTVTDETGSGYVTVFPCGGAPPNASNLNHTDQRTVANATVTKLSADGKVCVFNERPTHLIVDINGYFID